jgi:hypothetical protein
MNAAAIHSFFKTYRRRKLALVLAVWLGFGVTFLIDEEALPRLNVEVLVQLLLALLYFWVQIELMLRFSRWFDRHMVGYSHPARRYMFEALTVLASTLLLTTVLLAGPAYYWLEVANWDRGRIPHGIAMLFIRQVYLLYGTFTLLVYGLLAAYFAVRNLQQLELEAERYRKESVQEMLESLKNQVNPEFLFKSLHALSTLIYRDKDQAARFVDELSGVYRYVLDHKEEELVKLSHEMGFARSYLFLLSAQYPECLTWQLPAYPGLSHLLVPPLTLQMLLDAFSRVIEISPANPLLIQVALQGQDLSFKAQTQLTRPQSADFETQVSVLVERYRYLTDRKVSWVVSTDGIAVRVPLLEMTYEKSIP